MSLKNLFLFQALKHILKPLLNNVGPKDYGGAFYSGRETISI